MGVCPLSPELRVLKQQNAKLKSNLLSELKDLKIYGFALKVSRIINDIQPRYLLNEGILEDIDKIHLNGKASIVRNDENSISENIEEEIRESCIILENEISTKDEQDDDSGEKLTNSFENNLKKHESLVVQINIIYGKEIKRAEYSQSLKLFLKFAQNFQEHSYGGFLKPIYKQFCNYIYTLPSDQFDTVIDETCVFVQYIVKIIVQIYSLKSLIDFENGKLFKNQNIYNLVMSYLFRRTKIRKYLLNSIHENYKEPIHKFERKLMKYHKKSASFFGVSKKFLLQEQSIKSSQKSEEEKELKIINIDSEVSDRIETKAENERLLSHPYQNSMKLVEILCQKEGTPVTKLKTIVSVSKQIIKDVGEYYGNEEREAPDLDPDNLASIVIYLIVKNNNVQIYEELKLVQNFTTTNCMNCISGYYLNMFNAAIESILTLD